MTVMALGDLGIIVHIYFSDTDILVLHTLMVQTSLDTGHRESKNLHTSIHSCKLQTM